MARKDRVEIVKHGPEETNRLLTEREILLETLERMADGYWRVRFVMRLRFRLPDGRVLVFHKRLPIRGVQLGRKPGSGLWRRQEARG